MWQSWASGSLFMAHSQMHRCGSLCSARGRPRFCGFCFLGYWATGAPAASMPELRPGFFTFLGYWRRWTLWGQGISSLRGQSDQDPIARMTGAHRARHRRLLACTGALLALGLAGCGTISDETAGRAFMAPGRYEMYPCPNMEA